MENWLEKKDCTGCGVCSNICPKRAIKMVEDDCGFKYPAVDKSICIDCGLCKKVCPVLAKASITKLIQPKVYACWSKNDDNRFKSTSGGLFTEITSPIVKCGGYVVGAAYNKDNLVVHKVVHDIKSLECLRQSKYLQSDTLDIFIETKKLLDHNEKVAFCGSPCQIAGLYKFLKKEYPNLLTIEFICRGMNSPKAYKAWLTEIENKEHKKVIKVWFKYKVDGWKKSPKCTRVDFEDGSYKIYTGENNIFMTGYLNANLYIRPSCGICKFNGVPRQADITLADFWGVIKSLDDDKGTSMVLLNSQKGIDSFEKIKSCIFYEERNLDEIYDGNACFNHAVNINKRSEKFLVELNDNNFTKLVKKYSKVSICYRIKRKLKKYLFK